jgi:glucose/arabinose dehydrogenase
VKGTPVPWVRQDGGYFDIAAHPDYNKNGWIYLSYSELVPGFTGTVPAPDAPRTTPLPPSMTRVVRGRINANSEWVDQQEIYRAPAALYTPAIIHYGSRFLFDGKGHLYWTLGERGDPANAQNLSVPLGKIHRINDDGSVPKDNPFVNLAGADPTIWSYGHRNPEGLAWNPVDGHLWETEHGPTGGDEVNVIKRGANYGWGKISRGLEPGISEVEMAGMEQPKTFFNPAIGPGGITFLTSNHYKGWKNNLFITGMTGMKLFRMVVKNDQILSRELLLDRVGRVRDIKQGPDGLLYILLQNPTGNTPASGMTNGNVGMVVRLVPLKE